MRTPFWYTARPCGVPTTGEATKPRNSISGCERIAGDFADVDAGHMLSRSAIGDVQRIGAPDLAGVDGVDRRRHLVDIETSAGARRCRVDVKAESSGQPTARARCAQPAATARRAGLPAVGAALDRRQSSGRWSPRPARQSGASQDQPGHQPRRHRGQQQTTLERKNLAHPRLPIRNLRLF